jgi:Protein of unknown function (DUF3455)
MHHAQKIVAPHCIQKASPRVVPAAAPKTLPCLHNPFKSFWRKTMSIKSLSVLATVSAVALLSACGSMSPAMSMKPMAMYSQDSLPEAVKVPAGNKVALETVGVGDITYECRDKANAPGMTEWVFVGPNAALNDRSGKQIGKYYGPPATWEAMDGSKITGTQLAVAPAGAGNIPYQLVKANPAMGTGAMTGVTHIQRVALKGGVAPSTMCSPANKGAKEIVKYQADYIFWKAA